MATAAPNTTVTATDFAHAQVLYDVSAGDVPCRVYTVHNRDAAISVRVAVRLLSPSGELGTWMVAGTDGGAAIPPAGTVPFSCRFGLIGKVVVWTESGTPVIDGYVEAI